MAKISKKDNEEWLTYYEATKNNPPRETLVWAIDYLKKNNNTKNKLAYDVGCGIGYDASFIASQSIKTIATDANVLLEPLFETPLSLYPNLSFVAMPLEKIDFKKCHLINASFVLPFLSKNNLNKVIASIREGLVKNGLFSGQFFGVEDDWNHLTLLSSKQIEKYFIGFDVLYYDEFVGDRKGASGITKHSHIISFVLKKC